MPPITSNAERLVQQAQLKFGVLTDAEETLFRAVGSGVIPDYRTHLPTGDDPSNAESWDPSRVLKADRIAWLCTDNEATALVTHRGIGIVGARIEDRFDLECAKVSFPLLFDACAFTAPIHLRYARLQFLSMRGTHTVAIHADGLDVEGPVFLRDDFKAVGEVRFCGASIRGDLICNGAHILNPGAVSLNADRLKVGGAVQLRIPFRSEGEVSLGGATIGGDLDCEGAEFHNPGRMALCGDKLSVGGGVYLRNGFKAEGVVRLPSATVGSEIDCRRGLFRNPGAMALFADRMKVEGPLSLAEGFRAEGEVHLVGAYCGSIFSCVGGCFTNKGAIALNADSVNVAGAVHLGINFKAEGEVRLMCANIGSDLDCAEGQFLNPAFGARAFSADGLTVGGSVNLRKGFKAEGEVRLPGATIRWNLDCSGGQFNNPKSVALNADISQIRGAVFFSNGFSAVGEVRLVGATIGPGFDCSNSRFLNAHAIALNADSLNVEGNVFLRSGFHAEGGTHLTGATIGGDFDCGDGHFINEQSLALVLNGVNVQGGAYLNNGFEAKGEIRLIGAKIGGDLICEKGKFINRGRDAFIATRLRVEGSVQFNNGFETEGLVSFAQASVSQFFIWAEAASSELAALDLRFAKVSTLVDDRVSWPSAQHLLLDGFVYDAIEADSPTDASSRVEWLNRQPSDQFLPQPYEQLAEVFRKAGHDEEAVKVRIAKNRARPSKPFRSGWWWYRVVGRLIGYGYRPWRAFWASLALILTGAIIFGANYPELITATNKEVYATSEDAKKNNVADEYPRFNSVVYSLETFTPLLSLFQKDNWQPNANRGTEIIKWRLCTVTTGGLLRGYLWLHIIAGWTLTTLWVGGLTGLVKT